MSAITKGRLDPNKALDVAKFAVILGTPTQPLKCDKWLASLLKGKPPTFENKLDAVCTSGVTQKFLNDNKATIAHPEMNHCKKLAARVRAARGFSEWLAIHARIVEKVPRSYPTAGTTQPMDPPHTPIDHDARRCCSAACFVFFLGPMRLLAGTLNGSN